MQANHHPMCLHSEVGALMALSMESLKSPSAMAFARLKEGSAGAPGQVWRSCQKSFALHVEVPQCKDV